MMTRGVVKKEKVEKLALNEEIVVMEEERGERKGRKTKIGEGREEKSE